MNLWWTKEPASASRYETREDAEQARAEVDSNGGGDLIPPGWTLKNTVVTEHELPNRPPWYRICGMFGVEGGPDVRRWAAVQDDQ